MSEQWVKKEDLIDETRQCLEQDLDDVHPADRPEVLRKVAEWCTDKAIVVDKVNSEKGVPER